jgi:hypothetical protein
MGLHVCAFFWRVFLVSTKKWADADSEVVGLTGHKSGP